MSLFVTPTHYLRGVPRGKNYRRLLQVAREFCSEFSLVRRPVELSESGQEFERRLRRFLTRTRKVLEWPGTRKLGGEPETLCFYAFNDESEAVLAEVPGMLSFTMPDLSEDLAFYRNGRPWLWCTAHEHLTGLVITDAEARRIKKAAPLLMVRRCAP